MTIRKDEALKNSVMNSRNFEDLKQLIESMTIGEIATAKKFLVAFDSNVTRGKNKNQTLLKLLTTRPHISSEKAKKKISPEVDDRSFDRQVLRLREKLLESLLIDINTTKKEVHTPSLMAQMEIRKKYLQGDLLYRRGMLKEGLKLIERVAQKAEEFELYNDLVFSLYYLQQTKGLREGIKVFESFNERINLAVYSRESVEKSEDYYHLHFIKYVDSKGLNNDKVSFLMESIIDLEKRYARCKSSTVGWNLYILRGEYYLTMEDYAAASEIGFKIIELLKGSSSLYSPFKLGITYADMADAELFRYDFAKANEYALEAKKYYGDTPNGYNAQVAKEIEFRSHYYSNDLRKAETILDQLLELTKEQESDFLLEKRTYFKCCLLFLKGKFKECFILLQDLREIEEDKEGWNIGIRLLTIFTMFELKKLDNVEHQIEALRKHLSRYSDDVRKRDELIYRALKEMEKSSFDFEAVLESNPVLFSDLEKNESDYRWEVKTPEMIVFQDWFMAKLEGRHYTFELPASAREAMENPKTAQEIVLQEA